MLSLKSAYTILNKYVILLCNFVLVLYTTHQWGVEGRGIIALIVTNISIINILTNITSGSSVSFYASRKGRGALMLINAAGGMLLSCLGTVLICLFFGWNDFMRYFILSLLNALSGSIAFYYLGKGNIGRYNLLSLLNPLIALLVLSGFILWMDVLSIDYYFYSLYIGLSLSLLTGLYFLSREEKSINPGDIRKDFKDMVAYGFKNETSYFFQFLCYRLSYFVIAKEIDLSALGIFSVAVALVESIWVVSKTISMLHYASVLNEDQKDKNIEETRKKAIQSLIISIGLSFAIAVIPNEAFTFVFGRDFSGIKQILIYLIPGCIAIAFSNIYGHYFAAMGFQMVLIRKSIIGLLISIVLLYTLVPAYKINGVCIAMNSAYIIQSLYLLYYFNKSNSLTAEDVSKRV
jgi:O-antigen/teichoic acid export membrane protein